MDHLVKKDLCNIIHQKMKLNSFKISARRIDREISSIIEAITVTLCSRLSANCGCFIIVPYRYRTGAAMNVRLEFTESRRNVYRVMRPYQLISKANEIGNEKHRKLHLTSVVFVALFDQISKLLARGDTVTLRGLGYFSLKDGVPSIVPAQSLKKRLAK